jgi:hypothetical protein
MDITDTATAAKALGMAESEIESVEQTEHGVVVHQTDGSSYIDIPEDQPDAKGQTGLAYFVAPCKGYAGIFPVFAPPVDSDGITEADENSSAVPAKPEPSGAGDEAGGATPPADSGSPVPVKGA